MGDLDTADKLSLLSTRLESNRDLIQSLQAQASALREQLLDGQPSSGGGSGRDRGSVDFADYDTRFAELQKENQLLNQTIKQYESTLEIVMSKFRAQTQTIQRERHEVQRQLERVLEDERQTNRALREENLVLQERLDTSLRVMREAVRVDEETDVNSLITSLASENENLRQLLTLSAETAVM
ncbi:hypothetical protein HK104_001555 [Borealophlyctis nickersoniae]|nr:hypothetical protein HK104_001555 [Borealophlyctis nickersoniae]